MKTTSPMCQYCRINDAEKKDKKGKFICNNCELVEGKN